MLQTLKEIKGILNKLTPEKFEILSKQLIQLVTNKEVLHTTITMLFETAVAQPSFVAVYADFAASLSQVRPMPSACCSSAKTCYHRQIVPYSCAALQAPMNPRKLLVMLLAARFVHA